MTLFWAEGILLVEKAFFLGKCKSPMQRKAYFSYQKGRFF